MPLFFDTNMPIGYIFKWDPWHAYVLNVVEEKDSKYWSVTVEKESYRKFKHFRKNYIDLLYLLWHELNSPNQGSRYRWWNRRYPRWSGRDGCCPETPFQPSACGRTRKWRADPVQRPASRWNRC